MLRNIWGRGRGLCSHCPLQTVRIQGSQWVSHSLPYNERDRSHLSFTREYNRQAQRVCSAPPATNLQSVTSSPSQSEGACRTEGSTEAPLIGKQRRESKPRWELLPVTADSHSDNFFPHLPRDHGRGQMRWAWFLCFDMQTCIGPAKKNNLMLSWCVSTQFTLQYIFYAYTGKYNVSLGICMRIRAWGSLQCPTQ